jgi:CBS domain-containing protein
MWSARTLILDRLLPLAREGLRRRGVGPAECDRYLDVIGERVEAGRTGAQWALDSFSAMDEGLAPGARMRAICASAEEQQRSGAPVHSWELAILEARDDWPEDFRTVSDLMTTDVLTVHPEDLVDLAASVLEWERIRHLPVEDTDGRLVGILSYRSILRLVARGIASGEMKNVSVREVMNSEPITVPPEMTSLEAIALMREKGVSALPVVRDGNMIGIVTEHDFINVAARLLEDRLRES